MQTYRERQSDERYTEADITHWLYGYGEELSVSADAVPAGDVFKKRANGCYPAILSGGVYYLLDAIDE